MPKDTWVPFCSAEELRGMYVKAQMTRREIAEYFSVGQCRVDTSLRKYWELYTWLHSPSLQESRSGLRFVLDYIDVVKYYRDMKDTTKQYETTIRGHEYTFTAHSTKAGARATINESLNPCLVEVIVDGKVMYDAFPAGHPISEDAEIIERCRLTAIGYRWKTVGPREFDGARTGRGYEGLV